MAKNPGQNNNQEEGPPDLDELLNDLRKKIGRPYTYERPTSIGNLLLKTFPNLLNSLCTFFLHRHQWQSQSVFNQTLFVQEIFDA